MGITHLNQIQKYASKSKKYNPKTFKANTIIIDGNNLLFNRLAAMRSSFANSYKNEEMKIIDKSLLEQLVLILHSTTVGIVNMIYNTYNNKLKGEKNIIIVFDPPTTPYYYIPDVGNLTLKRKEEEKRKQSQESRRDKKQDIINELKLRYSDNIEQIYKQLSYLNDDSKIKMLMPIIKNELLYIYHKLEASQSISPKDLDSQSENENNRLNTNININENENEIKQQNKSIFNIPQETIDISNHVHFIQSVSEADLTICNIAKMMNYAPVLIRSMDSDYYVLCSELKNVYKTEITDKIKDSNTGKYIDSPIYNIYGIWRDIFGNRITYNDIISMATMAGNDYTAKASLYGFNVDNYKRLYNHDFSKITRSATYLYPYKEQGYTDIKRVVDDYCLVNEDARNSMLIYKHINENFEFENMNLSTITLNDIILSIKNELNDDFYDYNGDLSNISVIAQPFEFTQEIINHLSEIENQANLANINYSNVSFGNSNVDVSSVINQSINYNIDFGNVKFENVKNNIDSMLGLETSCSIDLNNLEASQPTNSKVSQIDYSNINFDF